MTDAIFAALTVAVDERTTARAAVGAATTDEEAAEAQVISLSVQLIDAIVDADEEFVKEFDRRWNQDQRVLDIRERPS